MGTSFVAIGLHFLGVDHIDVEGWIGHHEVALAVQIVLVLVEGVGLDNIPFQAMHCQVHLCQTDRGGRLFLAEERDPMGGVFAEAFNEVA